MENINLLPKDLAPKESFVGLAKVFRKLSLIGFILFFITASALISIFIYDTLKLRSALQIKKDLEKDVIALEQVEQKMVLLKDRISKASEVMELKEGRIVVEKVKAINATLPANTRISNILVDKDTSEVEFRFQDSSSLAQVLATILTSGYFEQVTMSSFAYTPGEGYRVGIKLI